MVLDRLFVKRILILLQFIPLSVKCFTPGPHITALVDNRLYFMSSSQAKELSFLDLHQSFDNSNVPWKDLTINVNLKRYNFATTAVFNENIFFIGGKVTQPDDPFIYVLNTLNENWSFPVISGGKPPQKSEGFQAVIFNGKIYLFVGSEIDGFGRMNVLNLQTLIWEPRVDINLPHARYGYTATLIPEGLILYIGGIFQNGTYANMNEIPIYDTLKDNWSYAIMNEVGGIIPEGRQMHSASLSSFNTIIIYGGYNNEVLSKILVILDISNPIYSWILPITGALKSKWGHNSIYFNSQMIVTFGFNEEVNLILTILSNPSKTSFDLVSHFSSFTPLSMPPGLPTSSPTSTTPKYAPTYAAASSGVVISEALLLTHIKHFDLVLLLISCEATVK
ncbi:unnamed protein product [Rhizophagus irregularis]|nr:unnamed protein product [Rhizophagus irregularis]